MNLLFHPLFHIYSYMQILTQYGYLLLALTPVEKSVLSMMQRKEGNVLFNDALNTFYLRLSGVRHGKGPLR